MEQARIDLSVRHRVHWVIDNCTQNFRQFFNRLKFLFALSTAINFIFVIILLNSVPAKADDNSSASSSNEAQSSTRRIVFTCSIAPELATFGKAKAMFKRAFKNLGYEFDMVHSPSGRRALFDANSGKYDGDCARVAVLNEVMPELKLIKVDTVIAHTELGVWSYHSNIVIKSADDVSGHYTFGFSRGTLMAEKFCRDNQLSPSATANTGTAAFKMLVAKRFDLLIMSSDLAREEVAKAHLENQVFKVGDLGVFAVYPYMNERHAELAIQLATELHTILGDKSFNQLPDIN